jgi:hypothetical protein
MDLIGQCSICGRPAHYTCSICGQLFCEQHFDTKVKMCTTCSPKASKDEKKRKMEDNLLH